MLFHRLAACKTQGFRPNIKEVSSYNLSQLNNGDTHEKISILSQLYFSSRYHTLQRDVLLERLSLKLIALQKYGIYDFLPRHFALSLPGDGIMISMIECIMCGLVFVLVDCSGG